MQRTSGHYKGSSRIDTPAASISASKCAPSLQHTDGGAKGSGLRRLTTFHMACPDPAVMKFGMVKDADGRPVITHIALYNSANCFTWSSI